ncbi:hypothetical protein EV421DRAFT_1729585 [Armillaria borealis]|uniref:Uncharacterized protein n=1 Tax=Armillaria borealis TaxID=47425 RepID=A0AA39K6Z4_9AGAR|nr:hypothetical protein EV421DRAFT_1729585 [Armillaria borealis]
MVIGSIEKGDNWFTAFMPHILSGKPPSEVSHSDNEVTDATRSVDSEVQTSPCQALRVAGTPADDVLYIGESARTYGASLGENIEYPILHCTVYNWQFWTSTSPALGKDVAIMLNRVPGMHSADFPSRLWCITQMLPQDLSDKSTENLELERNWNGEPHKSKIPQPSVQYSSSDAFEAANFSQLQLKRSGSSCCSYQLCEATVMPTVVYHDLEQGSIWSISQCTVLRTMTAVLSNKIIKKSGATAFPPASANPMRPLAFLSSSQGASPLFLVNTYGRHHAIMLRVDHSYGYPLEMPSVILSERRMYNAKTRIFQAKAKIRANSKDTNITARKVKSNNVRSIAITNELWNLTAGNASLEKTVETRKEDSNDRECIVVTDLSKNPTERKYLRRFIESIRQPGR